MSFSLTVTVEGGVATVTGQSTESAAPPDGTYSLTGHVETEGTAGPLLGISTPCGYVSASFPKRS